MTLYTVLDAAGNPIAGDGTLDDHLKAVADRENGTIVDDEGNTVYPELVTNQPVRGDE